MHLSRNSFTPIKKTRSDEIVNWQGATQREEEGRTDEQGVGGKEIRQEISIKSDEGDNDKTKNDKNNNQKLLKRLNPKKIGWRAKIPFTFLWSRIRHSLLKLGRIPFIHPTLSIAYPSRPSSNSARSPGLTSKKYKTRKATRREGDKSEIMLIYDDDLENKNKTPRLV